jgi:hypothetical protein
MNSLHIHRGKRVGNCVTFGYRNDQPGVFVLFSFLGAMVRCSAFLFSSYALEKLVDSFMLTLAVYYVLEHANSRDLKCDISHLPGQEDNFLFGRCLDMNLMSMARQSNCSTADSPAGSVPSYLVCLCFCWLISPFRLALSLCNVTRIVLGVQCSYFRIVQSHEGTWVRSRHLR